MEAIMEECERPTPRVTYMKKLSKKAAGFIDEFGPTSWRGGQMVQWKTDLDKDIAQHRGRNNNSVEQETTRPAEEPQTEQ